MLHKTGTRLKGDEGILWESGFVEQGLSATSGQRPDGYFLLPPTSNLRPDAFSFVSTPRPNPIVICLSTP
jgi:hypothetical protein